MWAPDALAPRARCAPPRCGARLRRCGAPRALAAAPPPAGAPRPAGAARARPAPHASPALPAARSAAAPTRAAARHRDTLPPPRAVLDGLSRGFDRAWRTLTDADDLSPARGAAVARSCGSR
jgi:hypothetical protein